MVAGLLLSAGTLLLLVPYLPGVAYWYVTVRWFLLVPFAAAGTHYLIQLLRVGDTASRWAAAFLVWALLASLLADDVRSSLLGGFAIDRGWVFLFGCMACWAVGRGNGRAAPLVELALVVGLLLGAILSVAQALVDGSGLLALSEARAVGFAPSSVYNGALLAGGAVLVAARVRTAGETWWAWTPAAVLLAAGVDLSGSRIALLATVGFTLWLALRAGWRRGLAILAAVALGLALAMAVTGSGDATSGSGRLGGGGGGGVGTRTAMWKAGGEAVLERPVAGWGPGQFRPVTSHRITAEFARAEGPDKLFFDAHNIAVETLVATGLVGVVLLGGFAWTASRGSRGPLGLFAAVLGITWLLEPVSIATAPLALLALGLSVAGKRGEADREAGSQPPVGPLLMALVVAVVGGHLGLQGLRAANHVYEAERTASLEAVDRARRIFPHDAALSDTATQILLVDASMGDEQAASEVLSAAERTVALEPARPEWWTRLAVVELIHGEGTPTERRESARQNLETAHERNPWSASTLTLLYRVAVDDGDTQAAERWEADLCRIDQCPDHQKPKRP